MSKRKFIAAVIAVIALVVGLLVVFAPSSNAAVQTGAREDRMFYQLLIKEAPSFRGASQKSLVKTAKSTCKYLRAGYDAVDAVLLMERNGFSESEAVAFTAASMVFYCPEQESRLQ